MTTEESLVEPGHFGDSASNIVVLRNFIDAEDVGAVQRLSARITKWDDAGKDMFNDHGECIYNSSYWHQRVCSDLLAQDEIGDQLYEIIDRYVLKMKTYLEGRFKVELSRRSPTLVRWLPGTEQAPHADKQLNDGSPNPFLNYDINSIFYWNADFDGGQLYYPQHGIELQIEPGMAIAHPGDIHYLHGVRRITRGERWTTPAFYTITKTL